MEIVGIVGFTNIFREPIMKLLVLPTFSMIFQAMALAHEVSRYSWKVLELLVLPTFSVSQSRKLSVLPTVSMIFQTMAPAHEVSQKSWKLLELLVLPTFSVSHSWKGMVLPTISMIPSVFAFGGSPKKLLVFIMLTSAASHDPTGAHDVRPTFAMNTSYVLMRCVFAKWAG